MQQKQNMALHRIALSAFRLVARPSPPPATSTRARPGDSALAGSGRRLGPGKFEPEAKDGRAAWLAVRPEDRITHFPLRRGTTWANYGLPTACRFRLWTVQSSPSLHLCLRSGSYAVIGMSTCDDCVASNVYRFRLSFCPSPIRTSSTLR